MKRTTNDGINERRNVHSMTDIRADLTTDCICTFPSKSKAGVFNHESTDACRRGRQAHVASRACDYHVEAFSRRHVNMTFKGIVPASFLMGTSGATVCLRATPRRAVRERHAFLN